MVRIKSRVGGGVVVGVRVELWLELENSVRVWVVDRIFFKCRVRVGCR